MLTASELLYRRARRIGFIGVIGVVAGVMFLALLLGGIVVIADLLEPASRPLVAAPLRW